MRCARRCWLRGHIANHSEGMPGIRVSFPGNHPSGASEQRGVDWRIRTAVPRETLANLSITGHLRCFSDQPGSKIIRSIADADGAGEISSTR